MILIQFVWADYCPNNFNLLSSFSVLFGTASQELPVNKITVHEVNFPVGKELVVSLTCSVNKKGPSTVPCGTLYGSYIISLSVYDRNRGF